MSPGLIVPILSILLVTEPVTTGLYLPALPAMTTSFGAAMSQAQLTLGVLLLAFGCLQLVWGPLSDRFGRRPILLWDLTACTLTSIGSALSAASYAGFFTFVVASSFLFIKVLGLNLTQYGLVMFFMYFSYLLGSFSFRRPLVQFGLRKSVALAACLSLLSGSLLGALAWTGFTNVWAVILPCFIYVVGHGVHQPCGLSDAVGPFRKAAGTASALNGFLMMLVAFAMGGWLATYMDGSVLPLPNSVWFSSIFIALSTWTMVRKYGEPVPAVHRKT